ncbi:MAG: elongation factor 1-beta [Candidatus Njordarchaeales archaeon]
MVAYNAVLVEIYPDDPDVNLENVLETIKERLPSDIELKDYKIEPLAFGINKLVAIFIIPEEEGKVKQLEDLFASIEGVSMEIQSITRI